MARKYGIPGTTGNTVVKEYLENNGIDLSKFTNNFVNPNRMRRKYEKFPGKNLKNNVLLQQLFPDFLIFESFFLINFVFLSHKFVVLNILMYIYYFCSTTVL